MIPARSCAHDPLEKAISNERGCEMTTDDQMLQARKLALKKAQTALELEGDVYSVGILSRLSNSDEGRKLSASQMCAIRDILDALEAVLQGNRYAKHPGDCRCLHEGRG